MNDWYKDAIVYELHVRAFRDSNADGIGDFRGLTEKLDYLQDLGVTAIWVLPFYPSPLRDDGYDIADYETVNPSYGTMRDMRTFIREAHRRGLKVISELVCNHTSDQHPWFKRARQARPGSSARNFYVWSDTDDRYREARIIFKDFETSNWTWDPVAGAYFWHRFYHHQPDLNFENPAVRRAIAKTMDYWLDMGIDGLRLDAIPYLYEREGTNCENLPETHAFLKELRAHVDRRFGDRMLLAEANQWPEDAVAYFGSGDECHMSFHFPVMPRMFMAVRMEDRYPIVDILTHTPPIPESSQWAMFLRNHDELTLEMVTDEERDYMYRVYAHDPQTRINLGIRRRLAPLLGNHRRRIELMNGLLFSLPGTPVLYYGDELGMGDNTYLGDRNGVRTPMQWSANRNAGFSDANPQSLFLPVIIDPEYHYQTVNVEAQQANPHSLLWWMKRLIALRKQHRAFGRGSIEFLHPENRKVLAFLRRFEDEVILVVVNLSRFAQYVELDLSAFRGSSPIELFGQSAFPPIGELPYLLTLGPHAFYWFSLAGQRAPIATTSEQGAPDALAHLAVSFDDLVAGRVGELNALLPSYLRARRWFGGKGRRLRTARVGEIIPIAELDEPTALCLINVDYVEGDPETYVLPLAVARGEAADHISHDLPHAMIAGIDQAGQSAILYDASVSRHFNRALLETVAGRRRPRNSRGELVGVMPPGSRELRRARDLELEPGTVRGEQSNSSVIFGEQYILKLFRRVEPGENPDAELSRFLGARGFEQTPRFVGTIELRLEKRAPLTLGFLQGFVAGANDAWRYTLDELRGYYERALVSDTAPPVEPVTTASLIAAAGEAIPPAAYDLIGPYLDGAELLGRRTWDLHRTLASDPVDAAFAPEPFSVLYQRSLYQSMRSLADQNLQLLRRRLSTLPEAQVAAAESVLGAQAAAVARFGGLLQGRCDAVRTRVHGDYHLGQVLYTGRDFMIIDFEGEPARPIGERRLKRSPLRDVAGMLRSFHYASHAAMAGATISSFRGEHDLGLESWARYWHRWVCVAFLRGYLASAGQPAGIVPPEREQLTMLLDVHLLEKAFYELGYEINNRPDWIGLPIQGIMELLPT